MRPSIISLPPETPPKSGYHRFAENLMRTQGEQVLQNHHRSPSQEGECACPVTVSDVLALLLQGQKVLIAARAHLLHSMPLDVVAVELLGKKGTDLKSTYKTVVSLVSVGGAA